MDKIKIATYNVNSIRLRTPIVIPWIEENKPEIICMQETKVANDKFPVKDFKEIGYKRGFGLVLLQKAILFSKMNLKMKSYQILIKALDIFIEIDEKRMIKEIEEILNNFL